MHGGRINWFRRGKEVSALRKGVLRIDMRTYPQTAAAGDAAFDARRAALAMLTAAVSRGLDVIGVLAPGSPAIGWTANQVARTDRLDIWVVPGEEYICSDGTKLAVYGMKQPVRPGLGLEQACAIVKRGGGISMACEINRKSTGVIRRLAESKVLAAIEVLSGTTGAFEDFDVPCLKFASSAAESPDKLDKSNIYTIMERSDFESMGIMPENYGKDYEPAYMLPGAHDHGHPNQSVARVQQGAM